MDKRGIPGILKEVDADLLKSIDACGSTNACGSGNSAASAGGSMAGVNALFALVLSAHPLARTKTAINHAPVTTVFI